MLKTKITAGLQTILRNLTSDYSEEIIVGKNQTLNLIFIVSSPKVEKVEIKVRITGINSEAIITGFVLGNINKCTLNTYQLHESPGSTSNLLVKSILTRKAKFNYHGSVRVNPAAQKTDAYQRNENLLLSPEASVTSEPELEILANDVRCTHGVVTTQMDKEQLWYLKSRGISDNYAKSLYLEGYLTGALNRISDKIVRNKVKNILAKI